MNKRVSIIRVIAGGYLVYLGVNLFRNMQVEQPENYMLMSAAAVAFVVIGALFVITGLRPMLKKAEKVEDLNEITEEESSEVAEESPEPDKSSPESDVEEPKPQKAKSLRERAMLGSANNADTDVNIASEDIIAATEEIIATQESESAIVDINNGGSKVQSIGTTNEETLDDGLTKVIK